MCIQNFKKTTKRPAVPKNNILKHLNSIGRVIIPFSTIVYLINMFYRYVSFLLISSLLFKLSAKDWIKPLKNPKIYFYYRRINWMNTTACNGSRNINIRSSSWWNNKPRYKQLTEFTTWDFLDVHISWLT